MDGVCGSVSGLGCGSSCGSSGAHIDLCSSFDEADAVSDDVVDLASSLGDLQPVPKAPEVDFGWYDDDVDDEILLWVYDIYSLRS